jgi:hypothetical protein
MEDSVPTPGTIEAVQSQLATIQKQLGSLSLIENVLGEIYSVLRDIRESLAPD